MKATPGFMPGVALNSLKVLNFSKSGIPHSFILKFRGIFYEYKRIKRFNNKIRPRS